MSLILSPVRVRMRTQDVPNDLGLAVRMKRTAVSRTWMSGEQQATTAWGVAAVVAAVAVMERIPHPLIEQKRLTLRWQRAWLLWNHCVWS